MGVQVPSPAPVKNLLELFISKGLNDKYQFYKGIDFFVATQKESEEILKWLL